MIVGVLALHGDSDVVRACFDWHLNSGVDSLCIALHRPTEQDFEVVEAYRDVVDVVFHVNYPEFDQHLWLEDLRNRAKSKLKLGVNDWFVHFDADEFWSGLEQLQSIPKDVPAVRTQPWVNYMPHDCDEFAFKEVDHFCPTSWIMYDARFCKVATRASSSLKTGMGNHDVGPATKLNFDSSITIDHFPIRTADQYDIKKSQTDSALGFVESADDARCWHWQVWAWHGFSGKEWLRRLTDPQRQLAGGVEPITAEMRQRLLRY